MSSSSPHPVSFYRIPGPANLFAGEYPGHIEPASAAYKLQSLQSAGMDCFVDLTHSKDGLEPYKGWLPPSISRHAHPIPDQGVPKHPFEMRQILDRIDEELNHGKTVYVHCWGGRGRTGTVVACWLRRRGLPPKEALAMVDKLWSGTIRGKSKGGNSPENPMQTRFVEGWQEPPPQAYEAWDRARGALLGLAAGDAVGAAVEFCPRGSFKPVTDLRGGGPHRLKAGEWTDDTSMALCLAESLIERKGFEPKDQMEKYLAWKEQGYLSATGECFDIGNTVASALRNYKTSGEPYAGSRDPFTAGNGSIMRLAPIPIRYWKDTENTIHYARESSRTTHGAAACLDACALMAVMMARAISGVPKEAILFDTAQSIPSLSSLGPDIQRLARGEYREKTEAAIRGSGYVVESLEAALWCVYHGQSFQDAVLRAANLGDDADTTAAVAGQIYGAVTGQSGVPSHWMEKLTYRDRIEAIADALLEAG